MADRSESIASASRYSDSHPHVSIAAESEVLEADDMVAMLGESCACFPRTNFGVGGVRLR